MIKKIRSSVLILSAAAAVAATADTAKAVDINALAEYAQIDRTMLDAAVTEATYQQKIIDTMTKPYESKPWYTYRKLFIIDQRISGGVDFWLKNEELLKRAEQTYGVPAEIICAIAGVETMYGKNMGTWRVLDALYTLGFHYPPRESYFSKEFANFVKLAAKEGWNITEIKGSYAGAMGMGQFMPSSYLNYAVDFDGDGHSNLFGNVSDAVGSIANYFKNHGWLKGGGVMYPVHVKNVSKEKLDQLLKKEWDLSVRELIDAGISTKVNLNIDQPIRLYRYELEDGSYDYQVTLNNFRSITRYNKSPLYARAVYELSEAIKAGYREKKLLQGEFMPETGRRP